MQLVAESAVIIGILLVLTFGGSVTTTASPRAWSALSNPTALSNPNAPSNPNPSNRQVGLNALGSWYNLTLTQLGTGEFSNVSYLIQTFHFVNIPTTVNRTALAANVDMANINASMPKAIAYFDQGELAIKAKEYVNATALILVGCAEAAQANKSFADFTGVQTPRLASQSVPTVVYKPGQDLTASEVQALIARCNSLSAHPGSVPLLLISSPQRTIETGGPVVLDGNLKLNGVGVSGQQVLFYVNGKYLGALMTGSRGDLEGTLTIPFLYKPVASVQAIAAPEVSTGLGWAQSNVVEFTILFNATRIVIGDPPTYLPTQNFSVEGNLTTVIGVPLPQAPVKITFFNSSTMTTTDSKGVFEATLTVPADAADGVYYVNTTFAPQGTFGPSFNSTLISVAHVPLIVTASGPELSFAGFPMTVSGSATANGSVVAGAQITASTPWGTYHTATDAGGHFTVDAPVSLTDFSFSVLAKVQANPAQPYISSGTAVARSGLLNPLLVLLPAVGVGVTAYEADKLDVFGRMRRRVQEQALLGEKEEVEPVQVVAPRPASELPEAVLFYRRALELATSRLGLKFPESQTIREALRMLEAKSSIEGTEAFRRILLTAEDFIYSQTFDDSRLDSAHRDLGTLEEMWR